MRNGRHVLAFPPGPVKSWVVWHELAHALQCERDWAGDSRAMLDAYAHDIADAAGHQPVASAQEFAAAIESDVLFEAAYWEHPYEVEARAAQRRDRVTWREGWRWHTSS
jgi:hypothetical protein